MLNSLRSFRLFNNVVRGVKASRPTRGEKAREYPHQVTYMDSRALPTTEANSIRQARPFLAFYLLYH
jgi:hypothetical protein